ncbi:MAG: DUF4145 domain-containing protein [Rhodospirillales bacterium]|nr:DUF4145 domain-containing protein [Rhodospirillales bacterium]
MLDRKELKKSFTINRTPDWLCPTCERGVLRIKDDTFLKNESACSRDHSHPEWEPEWIEYVFSCILRCTNDKCAEAVSLSGRGFVDFDVVYDDQGFPDQVWEDFFRPLHFQPPLRIISIPDSCPSSVSDPVYESFSLLFSSPDAAANSIRIAVEHLMTELKIKRFDVVKGKRRFISLHQRVNLLPAKYAELKDLLLAIKWLGNAGSHSHSKVTFDDVMDAYEFLEHVLTEIYDPKAKKLHAKAKQVNKKKGPAG